MIPDLHHMFVGLTQAEATRIVTMATAEVHPIDFATVFTATDTNHPSTMDGTNDVAAESPATVNKDEAADKKRKAVEATPPIPPAQRPKGNKADSDLPQPLDAADVDLPPLFCKMAKLGCTTSREKPSNTPKTAVRRPARTQWTHPTPAHLRQPKMLLRIGLMTRPPWNKVLSAPDGKLTGHPSQTSTQDQRWTMIC